MEVLEKDLELLYDMEKNNYFMEKTIINLQEEINSLGHPKTFQEPIKPLEPNYLEEYGNVSIGKTSEFAGTFATLGGIICGIWCIVDLSKVDQYIVGMFLATLLGIAFGAAIGAVVGLVVRFIYYLIAISKENKRIKEENKKIERQYLRSIEKYKGELRKYEENLKQDKIRVEKEKRVIAMLQDNQQKIREQIEVSSAKLTKFYDAVGIDFNYRNLIPIGYMYDYVRLGMATRLEGTEGLYYLIRKELREDQMLASVKTIIEQINRIIHQNSLMYKQLCNIANLCAGIAGDTRVIAQKAQDILDSNYAIQEQLKTNAALTREGNEQLRRNQEILKDLESNSELNNYIAERLQKEMEYQHYLENKLDDRITIIE